MADPNQGYDQSKILQQLIALFRLRLRPVPEPVTSLYPLNLIGTTMTRIKTMTTLLNNSIPASK
jgi:hypothetical protein